MREKASAPGWVYGLLSSLRACALAPRGAHLGEQVKAGVSAPLLSGSDSPPGSADHGMSVHGEIPVKKNTCIMERGRPARVSCTHSENQQGK